MRVTLWIARRMLYLLVAPVRVKPILRAIGIQAIEHLYRRVRFFSTIELVTALEKEKQQGKAGQITSRLLGLRLHSGLHQRACACP